jgi:putative DNA primase/helicase
MNSRNFFPEGKINYGLPGKFQRFSVKGKYKNSKDLFVVVHDYDRGVTFGDWHYPDDWTTCWNPIYGKPTISELKARQEESAQRRQEQVYERSRASWRARELWSKHYTEYDARDHLYVRCKKILPYCAKKVRSWLLVPVHNIHQELVTVQIIKPNGFKRFWKKTSGKELMTWLSHPIDKYYDGVIRICEGYATGCTIRHVTKMPVVCALSALNMVNIALDMRVNYPHAIIKICADNDKWGNENVGLKYAKETINMTGATLYYPIFDGLDCTNKPTDFNDLFVLSNENEVKRQLVIIRN